MRGVASLQGPLIPIKLVMKKTFRRDLVGIKWVW